MRKLHRVTPKMIKHSKNKNKGDARHFRLKSMVLARILAEATVFLILAALPLVLLAMGLLQNQPMTLKVILLTLSLTGAILLPVYGFITTSVKTTTQEICARSLFRSQSCSWSEIKKITRRSNWNWLRYVVEHETGELTFPIWMRDCDELVEIIRKRLPQGGGLPNPFRRFSQDPISIIFLIFQSVFGLGLSVVCWFFFVDLVQKGTDSSDYLLVLSFCIILTLLSIWRSFAIARMPRIMELTPEGISAWSFMGSKQIPWTKVKTIKPSLPLMPDGYTVVTEAGSFLLGDGIDSLDELVDAVKARCKSTLENSEKQQNKK